MVLREQRAAGEVPSRTKGRNAQETSKYGIEQLRRHWGERVPQVVSAPRRALLGTGCLFQLEERRARSWNLRAREVRCPVESQSEMGGKSCWVEDPIKGLSFTQSLLPSPLSSLASSSVEWGWKPCLAACGEWT